MEIITLAIFAVLLWWAFAWNDRPHKERQRAERAAEWAEEKKIIAQDNADRSARRLDEIAVLDYGKHTGCYSRPSEQLTAHEWLEASNKVAKEELAQILAILKRRA